MAKEKTNEAAEAQAATVVGLTEEQVKQMLDDCMAAAGERFNKMKLDLIAEWEEKLGKVMEGHLQMDHAEPSAAPTASLTPVPLNAAAPVQGTIDAAYLTGLTYRTSKPRKGGADDDDATVHEMVTRALTPDDVLGWRDLGDSVRIVTADGQTYTVKK